MPRPGWAADRSARWTGTPTSPPASPRAGGSAWLREELAGALDADSLQDVLWVSSELVSLTITHTATSHVGVDVRDADGWLRVEIWFEGPDLLPTPLAAVAGATEYGALSWVGRLTAGLSRQHRPAECALTADLAVRPRPPTAIPAD